MPTWLRIPLAIVAGFCIWFAVATVGNFVIRWLVPGYAEVERALTFSSAMMFARLLVGGVASLAAGAACFVIGGRIRAATYVFAVVLLAFFVAIHIDLWTTFPVWYHVVFLGSLVPLVILGARLPSLRRPGAA